MEVKMFEVLDRGTWIPALATRLVSTTPKQWWLMSRAGYEHGAGPLLLLKLEDGQAETEAEQWAQRGPSGGTRTMFEAHRYIEANWNALRDGDVVDIEFILKETAARKVGEYKDNPELKAIDEGVDPRSLSPETKITLLAKGLVDGDWRVWVVVNAATGEIAEGERERVIEATRDPSHFLLLKMIGEVLFVFDRNRVQVGIIEGATAKAYGAKQMDLGPLTRAWQAKAAEMINADPLARAWKEASDG